MSKKTKIGEKNNNKVSSPIGVFRTKDSKNSRNMEFGWMQNDKSKQLLTPMNIGHILFLSRSVSSSHTTRKNPKKSSQHIKKLKKFCIDNIMKIFLY
jgi:hypothetical protein